MVGPQRGRGRGKWGDSTRQGRRPGVGASSDIQERIVSYLKLQHKPMRPIHIAKGVNLSCAKDVNPTLYRLEKIGQVKKYEGNPPTWAISGENMDLGEPVGGAYSYMTTGVTVNDGIPNTSLSTAQASIDTCISVGQDPNVLSAMPSLEYADDREQSQPPEMETFDETTQIAQAQGPSGLSPDTFVKQDLQEIPAMPSLEDIEDDSAVMLEYFQETNSLSQGQHPTHSSLYISDKSTGQYVEEMSTVPSEPEDRRGMESEEDQSNQPELVTEMCNDHREVMSCEVDLKDSVQARSEPGQPEIMVEVENFKDIELDDNNQMNEKVLCQLPLSAAGAQTSSGEALQQSIDKTTAETASLKVKDKVDEQQDHINMHKTFDSNLKTVTHVPILIQPSDLQSKIINDDTNEGDNQNGKNFWNTLGPQPTINDFEEPVNTNYSDTEINKILQRLKRHQEETSSSQDLYHNLGYASEAEIEPILKYLQGQGMIKNVRDEFFRGDKWKLLRAGKNKLIGHALPGSVPGPNVSGLQQPPKRGIPLSPLEILRQKGKVPPGQSTATRTDTRDIKPFNTLRTPVCQQPLTIFSTQAEVMNRPTPKHFPSPCSSPTDIQPPPAKTARLFPPTDSDEKSVSVIPRVQDRAPRTVNAPFGNATIPRPTGDFQFTTTGMNFGAGTPGYSFTHNTQSISPVPKKTITPCINTPPDGDELKILHRLSRLMNKSASFQDLKTNLGFAAKKDLNQLLYGMQTKGWIKKAQASNPPIWKLLNEGRNRLLSGNASLVSSRPPPRAPRALVTAATGPGTRPLYTREDNAPSSSLFRPSTPAVPIQTTVSGIASGFRPPASPAQLLMSRAGVNQAPCMPTPFTNIRPLAQSPASKHLGVQISSSQLQPAFCQGFIPPQTSQQGSSLIGETFSALNKNPVSALMEYAQSRKMTATIEIMGQEGPAHRPRFRMAAVMDGRVFPEVENSNKKDAKTDAADQALRTLMAEGQLQSTHTPALMSMPKQAMTHFDRVASLSHQQFSTLAAGITDNIAGRKVLATLVIKTSPQDEGTVISMGTGNRCITGEYLSLEGRTVNDSHAEIITRRGFIRFLYRQLLESQPGSAQSILEPSASGKLKVKDTVTFHLYISTAPCGDGALFSPRDADKSVPEEVQLDQLHNPTFSNKVQGVLRTKMEGGEGTIPVEPGFKGQTWDGILRGERLRTMSCSDKLCRWNLVGMQGALLSHFLDPVYLASLTLGYLYDHGHLSRAMCCRLSNGEPDISSSLPPGYRVNHPHLGRVTVYDPPRETQKTKEFSVNWSLGDPKPEVTDGTKGILLTRVNQDYVSQVCKANLYQVFRLVCERLGRQDLLQAGSYGEAKSMAKDFVTAKQLMLHKFKKTGYGHWVSKPVEEEMFQ